jgi:hypothetical protein
LLAQFLFILGLFLSASESSQSLLANHCKNCFNFSGSNFEICSANTSIHHSIFISFSAFSCLGGLLHQCSCIDFSRGHFESSQA